MSFLKEIIITGFGAPTKITIENAKDFMSLYLLELFLKYGIILSHSYNYYPQGNELAEYINKNLMNIVKKIVGENNNSWDSNIKYDLWEYCITTKTSTRKNMFELVYGLEAKLPINLHIHTPQFSQ
jgi:hypothetical protein